MLSKVFYNNHYALSAILYIFDVFLIFLSCQLQCLTKALVYNSILKEVICIMLTPNVFSGATYVLLSSSNQHTISVKKLNKTYHNRVSDHRSNF